MDLETGEVYEFGPFPESLYYLHQTMAITDQGLLFISDGSNNGGQIASIDLTGKSSFPKHRPVTGSVNRRYRYLGRRQILGRFRYERRIGQDGALQSAALD